MSQLNLYIIDHKKCDYIFIFQNNTLCWIFTQIVQLFSAQTILFSSSAILLSFFPHCASNFSVNFVISLKSPDFLFVSVSHFPESTVFHINYFLLHKAFKIILKVIALMYIYSSTFFIIYREHYFKAIYKESNQ